MATNARQNNATVLNGAGAFARAIANTDQLTWSGITGTNATVLMGGAIDVSNSVSGGISVLSGQTVAVTINHSSQVALSLGALGVDMSAAGADLTLGPTAVVFIPVTQSWNVASGRTLVVSGTMTGSGALTKAGSGNLFLTGSGNNNNGTFTVNAGNVLVANYNSGTPNQLGSVGTIALGTSGGIQYCGNTAYSSSSNITGSGSAGVVVRNTSATGFTFNAGALVAGTYTGAFTMYADGNEGGVTAQTVTFNDAGWTGMQYAFLNNGSATGLTQTFKHAGTTTATMAGPLYLQTAAANQVAVLQASSTGNIVWNGSVAVLGNSGGTMTLEFNNSSSGTTTFGGAIADNAYTLNVRKSGTGTTTFSGANSFDGTVQVTAGTLNANSATALGAASSTAGISVTSGATLSLGGASNITYNSPGRTLTLAGTGVASLGTPGALVIANAVTNTFGGIALTAGTLIRASESGTLTAPVTTNNHNLTFTVASGKTLTLPSTSVISASTSTVSYHTVSGDTGTAVVSAQNLYTNPTVIGQGTVRVGASSVGSPGSLTSGPLGRGQLTWNGGALDAATTATLGNNVVLNGNVVFRGTAALTLAGTVSLIANSTITTDGFGGELTLSGVMSGTGFSLTKAGTNTLILSNTNTRTGNTTIRAGTVVARSPLAFGSSGTITLNDASTGTLLTRLQINASAQDITVNQSIVVANFGTGITIIGSATTAGSFIARFQGSVTLAKDVTINGGITGDRLEFSGGISGTGNVTIIGLNRVVFMTTANTYAGTTTIDGAILQLSDGTATAASLLPDTQSVTVGAGGVLNLAKGANSQTIDALNGSGTVSQIVPGAATLIVGNNNGSGTFSGNLTQSAGSLALTKTGTGTQTLTGASTHSGGTNIAAGTLQTGNVQALGTSGTVTLTTSGATLQTLTTGGQNGKLTVAALTNSAGGTIKIGG